MSSGQFRRPDQLTDAEREDLVCIGSFPNARAAHDAGTVVLSMKEWYVLLPVGRGMGLHVRSEVAERAMMLLERTSTDNRSWPGPSLMSALPGHRIGAWHLIPYPALLVCSYWVSTSRDGYRLFEWGRFDSVRILTENEWWRLATTLLLHGDLAHLAGNVAFGLIFGALLGHMIGMPRVYGGALMCGILGNLGNLWTFGLGGHLSIGASTAVFGLIGGLLGVRLCDLLSRKTREAHGRRLVWILLAPVGAGLALLGFLGSGGLRTDVLAHLYGFLAGVVVFGLLRWWRG